MKILIGTVNFNSKPFTEVWLKTLIESLRESFGTLPLEHYKIVIVNNSPEDDLSDLKDNYKYVTFIDNKENVGVAAAWNQVIKEGFDDKGNPLYDYYMPTNNDLIFTKTWAKDFLACLIQDPKKEFAWISSFLNDYKEPDLTGVTETVQLENRYWGGIRQEADDIETVDQVENMIKAAYAPFGGIESFAKTLKDKYKLLLKEMHPKAPCFALSKECIKKVGLFDEYNSPNGLHEDADYCKRVELAGFKLGAAFGAYCHHASMMSRSKGKFKESWWVQNRESAFKEKWKFSSKEMHLIPKDIKFKLDIGSGENPKKDTGHWYHLDIDKQFKDVEFLQDVTTNLPFEDSSIEEIYSSNVLEHVEWKEVPATLFEWCRVLCSGGKIHLRVPNFRWVMEQYVAGRWNMSFVEGTELNAMHIVYGGDHKGIPHLHKSGFEFDTLKQLLEDCGIKNIRNVSDPNSWELKIEGIK